MGVGVAWFAWVVSFVVVLGVGLLARSKASSSAMTRICQSAWWLQLAAGGILVAIWVSKRAA